MGSQAPATLDRSVTRSRSSSRAYLLRRLSRSATARRQRSSSLASSASESVWEAIASGGLLPTLSRSSSVFECSVELTMAGSVPVELGVDHVVVANSGAPAVAGGLPVAAAGWHGFVRVTHLLQFGCQRLHPLQRGLVLDGLPRVGDQHLGACPVMWRR